MGKIKYLSKRILSLDYKNMLNIAKGVAKKAKKNYLFILFDMVICGIKYQAGYYDYQEFEFYNLNKKERKTYLTRGKNNEIVKRFNDKSKFYIFDNKEEMYKKFAKFLKRDWMIINKEKLEEFINFFKKYNAIVVKPVDGEGGKGVEKFTYSTEEEAKRILGDLLVLAEDGVAISDFSVGSDGCAEAEVYAPADAEITFNGEALAFEGGCCKVSDNTGAFVLENGAEGVSVPYGKITVLDDFTDSVEKITVFGADLNPDENAKIEQSQQDGKDTVSVEMGEENHVLTYAFAESTVDAETDRLYLGVYLSGTTSRVEVTLYLQGEQNRLYALDTVYLSPGYNQIEIERLCDADWSRLYNAKYLRFGFSDSGAFTLDFAYLFKSE